VHYQGRLRKEVVSREVVLMRVAVNDHIHAAGDRVATDLGQVYGGIDQQAHLVLDKHRVSRGIPATLVPDKYREIVQLYQFQIDSP
jgi:hypothetical protein